MVYIKTILNIILSVQTDLVILAHVDLSLKTDALVKAEQIWRTPLKLWRQRQMSATAVHFSMACEKQCAMFRGARLATLYVSYLHATRHVLRGHHLEHHQRRHLLMEYNDRCR